MGSGDKADARAKTLSSPAVNANPGSTRVVLADPMEGVRDAWRWVLAGETGLVVSAEAGTVRDAAVAPGDVVLAGLRFPDGTAADLAAGDRPVVVWTFLPADERGEIDLSRAAAVLPAGTLRERLAAALRQAAGEPGED